MPIDKLEEFARDGQKNTDELILTDGFPRPKFPARQWFNYLFNMFSLKINEIIELDPISKTEIVDNLTTNDATKVASARTVKELQDNKLESEDIKDATTEQKGIVKLNNTLTSNSPDEALTAGQGRILNEKISTVQIRACCSFDGSSAPVILFQDNIASITVTTLTFSVVFKKAMPTKNYVISGFASDVNNSNRAALITMNPSDVVNKTVNGFDFYARYSSNSSSNIASPLICFSIMC